MYNTHIRDTISETHPIDFPRPDVPNERLKKVINQKHIHKSVETFQKVGKDGALTLRGAPSTQKGSTGRQAQRSEHGSGPLKGSPLLLVHHPSHEP